MKVEPKPFWRYVNVKKIMSYVRKKHRRVRLKTGFIFNIYIIFISIRTTLLFITLLDTHNYFEWKTHATYCTNIYRFHHLCHFIKDKREKTFRQPDAKLCPYDLILINAAHFRDY